jgi:hypothetical protein
MNQGHLKHSEINIDHSITFGVGSELKNMFLSWKECNPREEFPYLDITWLVG